MGEPMESSGTALAQPPCAPFPAPQLLLFPWCDFCSVSATFAEYVSFKLVQFFRLKFILKGSFSCHLGMKTQHPLLDIEGQCEIKIKQKQSNVTNSGQEAECVVCSFMLKKGEK